MSRPRTPLAGLRWLWLAHGLALVGLGLLVEVDCALQMDLPPIGVLYRSDDLPGNRVLRAMLELVGDSGDLGMVPPG